MHATQACGDLNLWFGGLEIPTPLCGERGARKQSAHSRKSQEPVLWLQEPSQRENATVRLSGTGVTPFCFGVWCPSPSRHPRKVPASVGQWKQLLPFDSWRSLTQCPPPAMGTASTQWPALAPAPKPYTCPQAPFFLSKDQWGLVESNQRGCKSQPNHILLVRCPQGSYFIFSVLPWRLRINRVIL